MGRPSCTINLGKRVCLFFLSRRTFGAASKRVKPYEKRLPWQRPTSTPLDSSDPGFCKLYLTHPEVQFHPVLLEWFSTSPRGTFSTNLKGQIDKLQLELHQQLQDIQHLTKQEVFQTLHDNLGWLNPKNLFDELNQNVGLWSHWLLTDYNNALCTALHLQAIFPGSCERPASSKLCGIYSSPK